MTDKQAGAASASQPESAPDVIAAVDLGSNSFHMLVARSADGNLIILDRLRNMVRLGAGLDDRGRVSQDAAQRALECLSVFGQRLSAMHAANVRAVGTNTFRRARNAGKFLRAAEQALGHPIEVISGREEARLVYLGAAQSTPNLAGRRLVVDIGGGSTELIVGEGFDPDLLLSLYMGCVSISQEYFPNGKLSARRMRRARLAARMELEPVSAGLRKSGWEYVIGTSGTIRATATILRENGWVEDGISLDGMQRIADELVTCGHVDKIQVAGLAAERAPVYAGGLAILMGVFEALDIDSMRVSDGALREGLLYDLLGRLSDEDVRVRTVGTLQKRYHVEKRQAALVEKTAMTLLAATRKQWDLDDPLIEKLLRWAARLHEIGLAIAHAGHHKHGAYLLEHADLPGFSQREQAMLAQLVRAHRRKLVDDIFVGLDGSWAKRLPMVAILLRLAVLLNRSRSAEKLPAFGVTAGNRRITLEFPDGWLDGHPLTRADLRQEARWLRTLDFKLRFD